MKDIDLICILLLTVLANTTCTHANLDLNETIDIPLQGKLSLLSPEEPVRVMVYFRGSVIDNISEYMQTGDLHVDPDSVSGIALAGSVAELSKMDEVLGIFEDKRVHLLLDDSVPLINARELPSYGITGNGINVCVVDTGIDDSHTYLRPLLAEIDYVNGDNDATDDHGHGTHVAGIIASQHPTYRGVSPGVNLLAAKVLDKTGTGYESDVIRGIEWCIANHADVISLSLGADYYGDCDNEPLGRAVNEAVEKGVVVAVAAGNDGAEVDLPACASGPIAVGAISKDGSVHQISSRGKELDLLAPGISIISTYSGNRWAMASGTSMATPHVSAAAALLLETDPGLEPCDILDKLKETARAPSKCFKWTWENGFKEAVETECTREITGAGIIDVYGAYRECSMIVATPEFPSPHTIFILVLLLPAAGYLKALSKTQV